MMRSQSLSTSGSRGSMSAGVAPEMLPLLRAIRITPRGSVGGSSQAFGESQTSLGKHPRRDCMALLVPYPLLGSLSLPAHDSRLANLAPARGPHHLGMRTAAKFISQDESSIGHRYRLLRRPIFPFDEAQSAP